MAGEKVPPLVFVNQIHHANWSKKLILKTQHVLLVIYNYCPAHQHDLSLTNIKIMFLGPNMTVKLQPWNLRVMQSLKFTTVISS